MFCIKIADVVVEIDNRYAYVENYCKEFICTDDPDPVFRVKVSQGEIENYLSHAGYKTDAPSVECLLINRQISAKIPEYDIFLFHSAVVSCPECTVAFSAKRGGGKTTHALLWQRVFGKRAVIINGDKPLIKRSGNDFIVFGTPWGGKEKLGSSLSAKLDAVCFIEKAPYNKIHKISDREFAQRLAEQVIYPEDSALRDKFADLAAEMIKNIPAYVLECTVSCEAVDVAFREIVKNLSGLK